MVGVAGAGQGRDRGGSYRPDGAGVGTTSRQRRAIGASPSDGQPEGVIALSRQAELHIDALREHFERLDRPEAIRNLTDALTQASSRIETRPRAGQDAPRPYPSLKSLGLLWTKAGSYWFAYLIGEVGPIIAGVFHETADIPNRVSR